MCPFRMLQPLSMFQDCYTVCEKMHKEALSHLSKAQLVEQQPVRHSLIPDIDLKKNEFLTVLVVQQLNGHFQFL